MKIARVVAAVAASLAATAFAADHLELPGATSAFYILKPHAERIRAASDVDLVVAPVGASQAVLDVIDGRAEAAIVTTPLVDAVSAARELAWTQGRRILVVQPGLMYTQLPSLDSTGRPLGIVSASAASPALARVVRYLTSTNASLVAASR